MTGPAFAALRRAWPSTQLLLVTHARYAELGQAICSGAQVVALGAGENLWHLAERLRALHVEAVCDLHGSWRSWALTMLLRPRLRSRWLKRSLHTWAANRIAHAPYRPARTMDARYHDAVEALVGSKVCAEAMTFALTPNDHREGNARMHAARIDPNRAIVALMPGAAWATKRWPIAHFAHVARALLAQGHQVIALGSTQDAALTAAIAQRARGVCDLGGPMTWGVMAQIIGKSQAVVVGDTGPMHVARAIGTPTVVLFGSTPASQFDLSAHQPISGAPHCSPCSFYGLAACPRGHLKCLTSITPEVVISAVRRILERPRSSCIEDK